MTTKAKRTGRRRGATAVETALVLSAFLLFLFGLFEYSRLLMVKQVCDNAAREGARYAVVHTADKSIDDVRAEVVRRLAGVEAQLGAFSPQANIEVYRVDENGNRVYQTDASGNVVTDSSGNPVDSPWTSARFGEGVAVDITGTYRPVLPEFLFLGQTIPVRGRSIMQSEAN